MSDDVYAKRIGSRLQAVRQDRRLTLEDLEQRSQGGFTVDVLVLTDLPMMGSDGKVDRPHDSSVVTNWAQVEFPALKANPYVRSITAINPQTGKGVLIWAR